MTTNLYPLEQVDAFNSIFYQHTVGYMLPICMLSVRINGAKDFTLLVKMVVNPNEMHWLKKIITHSVD